MSGVDNKGKQPKMDMIINSAFDQQTSAPFSSDYCKDDKQVWDKNMDEILVKLTLYKCRFCLFFCSIPSGIFTHCKSIHPQKVNPVSESDKMVNTPKSFDSGSALKDTANIDNECKSCTENSEELPSVSTDKSTCVNSFEHGYSKWLDQNYACDQQPPSGDLDGPKEEIVYREGTETTSIGPFIEETEQEPQCQLEEYSGGATKEMIENSPSDDKKLYLCAECNLLFSSLDDCSTHLLEVHKATFSQHQKTDSAKIKSTTCYKKKYKRVLSKKLKGPIDCEICRKTFASVWTLRNHINHVHNQLKKHKCKQCDYTAARAEMVKLHMRTHTGEKPFLCDSCPFNTADPNSLRRHKMIHSGRKPFNCNYCPYSVKKASALLSHLKMRHPGMGQIYTCDSCDFETVSKVTFQKHICKNSEENVGEGDVEVKMEESQYGAAHNSLLDNQQINETYLIIKEEQDNTIHERNIPINRSHALVRIAGLSHPVTVDLGT